MVLLCILLWSPLSLVTSSCVSFHCSLLYCSCPPGTFCPPNFCIFLSAYTYFVSNSSNCALDLPSLWNLCICVCMSREPALTAKTIGSLELVPVVFYVEVSKLGYSHSICITSHGLIAVGSVVRRLEGASVMGPSHSPLCCSYSVCWLCFPGGASASLLLPFLWWPPRLHSHTLCLSFHPVLPSPGQSGGSQLYWQVFPQLSTAFILVQSP